MDAKEFPIGQYKFKAPSQKALADFLHGINEASWHMRNSGEVILSKRGEREISGYSDDSMDIDSYCGLVGTKQDIAVQIGSPDPAVMSITHWGDDPEYYREAHFWCELCQENIQTVCDLCAQKLGFVLTKDKAL